MSFFHKNREPALSPEQIAEIMKGIAPEYDEKAVQILYSTDGLKRFVILRSPRSYFRYMYETAHILTAEERRDYGYTRKDPPAVWKAAKSADIPLFSTEEETVDAVRETAEFKEFFN